MAGKSKKSAASDVEQCPHFTDTKNAKFDPPKIRKQLLKWYDEQHRFLPWRRTPNSLQETPEKLDFDFQEPKGFDFAYGVWISEVMLQQTRVATVIDYWTRWVKKWPNSKSLSKATSEEVNSMWAGLGYYRRAQNLLKGACFICENYDGELPNQVELLLKIPGVGQYTAGAIASIAHQTVAPLVDGNVVRVVSRLRRLSEDPKSKSMVNLHWEIMRDLVDRNRPGDFNQAVMELGATHCSVQNPKCSECPISAHCGANKCGDIENFPLKVAKKKAPEEHRLFVVFEDSISKKVLISQRPETGLLANQFEFPNGLFPDDSFGSGNSDLINVLKQICKTVSLPPPTAAKRFVLGDLKHVFSQVVHFCRVVRVVVDSKSVDVDTKARPLKKRKIMPEADAKSKNSLKWVDFDELDGILSTSGQKKILTLYGKSRAAGGGQRSIDSFFGTKKKK